MIEDLRNLDPVSAWRVYEPSTKQPWNRRRAAHLLRRAGFNATWQELNQAVADGPEKTLDRIFALDEDAAFERQMEPLERHMLATGDVQNLPAWWLYRMLHTPTPLVEKSTLFWHGHFATSAAKVDDAKLMLQQNQFLRTHALGSFCSMVRGIARDPAMLIYLDSQTNRKTHPNENFAREVMELFCLGLNQYTERDIQQLARCFTGWEIRRGKFHFNPYQHDDGEKLVLGQRGNFDGDEAIDIILGRPAAARFIAAKLVRFFVTDQSPLPERLLEPLAAELREHEFEIAPTLRRILASQWFFADATIGNKVRSPIELAVGLLRALNASTNVYELAAALDEAGQRPFFPPNVKGWEGGKSWINSATFIARANLVHRVIGDEQTKFGGGELAAFIESCGVGSPGETVDWLLELLVAVPVPDEVRVRLQRDVAARNDFDAARRVAQTIVAVTLLPEFQLG